MKKSNNKGFSLVELIIVIAIMAVLVGLLAPQYLKYVHNSKVSTDISNAQDMATAFNVAYADAEGATIDTSKMPDGKPFPTSKVDSSYTWDVKIDDTNKTGVESITLGGMTIWPNPKDSGNYYDELHKK